MATDYTPGRYDFDKIPGGDTLAAVNFVRSDTPTANLSAVSWKVYPSGSETASISKSNGSGITINDAETWDFDIDSFDVSLAKGHYWHELVCTDANGEISTMFQGTWRIL